MKVLVVKIAAIGDFLMATPALRALKRSGRVSELHVLAGRSIAAVVAGNPDVDKAFYIDDRRVFHGNPLAKVIEVMRVSWRLRRERFAVGFNFHRDWRFDIVLFLAGCRRRIGFARNRRHLLLTEAVTVEGIKHHVFHYCDLVKALGIFCLDFRMVFPVGRDAEAAVEEKFLRPHRLADYVVLAPGGASNVKEEMESRRWPVGNFIALAGLLVQSGKRVLLVGGGSDTVVAGRIREAHPEVVDFSGKTTLAEAAALLKRSRLVICNDSGLMHLADAVGARVVSIFGPTHPDEKRPLHEGNIALWKGEAMECSPCYHDGVFPRCDHLNCLKKITPQEVFDTIRSL